MPAKRKATSPKDQSTATIGFEAKLWLAADKLRNNMDAAEYKHVVLGIIFLKYISDTFEEHRAKLLVGEHRLQLDAHRLRTTFHTEQLPRIRKSASPVAGHC